MNFSRIRNVLSIILSLCFSMCCLNAQTTSKHYLSIYLEEGIQSLHYSLTGGKTKDKSGSGLSMEYNYLLLKNLFIRTGITISTLSSQATINYMESTSSIDSQSDAYTLRTYYFEETEKQKVVCLSWPVGISRIFQIDKKSSCMVSMGAKVSYPLQKRYRITGGKIELRGYYSQWNVEMSDMPQHGFYTTDDKFSGTFSLKTMFTAFVDIGWLYKISDKYSLYGGLFIEHGVNQAGQLLKKQLYQSNGVYNGVVNSNLVTKVMPLLYGVKIGCRIDLKKNYCRCTWN
jgi:OmpA-OmpF porin, OOP family